MIRKRIVFTGAVQGVGFRWRARQAANMFRCTGFCRNEWDGSVTMEIQGEEDEIERVLQALHRGRYIEIEGMDVRSIPLKDERSFKTE